MNNPDPYGEAPDDYVPCEYCERTGKVERGHPNAPEPEYIEKCPVCGGSRFVRFEEVSFDEDEASMQAAIASREARLER